MMVASWEWLLLTALISLSALFSGSETALTSLNRPRIRHLAEQGDSRAMLVDDLLKRPNRMLSTILIGNNLVNISITALATTMSIRLFGQRGVGIAIATLTVLLLLFGEITPKTFAAANGEWLSFHVARPIGILEKLFSPAVKTLSSLSSFFIRLLGGTLPKEGIFVTEEEIRTLVDLGEGQGTLEAQERTMITNVFELNDTLVREVMLPRIDAVALPVEAGLQEAWQISIATGHSRIPVYQDSLDQMVGIIHAKDLMRHGLELNMYDVREIMREPLFVPETKRVSELLREMRQAKTHIAVVLDEYGGTAGLAFLEDLVETIVGEMGDEFDKTHPLYEKIGAGDYIFNARISVDDVNELLNEDLPQEEYDTVGGLAFHLFGHVPAENESIHFADLTITIEAVEKNRIHKIRMTKTAPDSTN
ncbi:MAG: hemolysin family protein [Firmicutes bacterium]|nr:hemolysin family protein [Bacillota bacterium]